MEKYQIFVVSTILLIMANYWHLISRSALTPRLFDYVAYGLFLFGIYKLIKNKK